MPNYDNMTLDERIDLDIFLLRLKPYARQEIATLERWVRETPEGKAAELMRRDLNETKARFELIYGESYERYIERMKRNEQRKTD